MTLRGLIPSLYAGERRPRRIVWDEDPFSRMQDSINAIMRGFSEDFPSALTAEGNGKLSAFNPQINVEEDEQAITVTAELPGMKEEEVDVTLRDDCLLLSGEKKEDYEKTEGKVHYVGRSYGSFSRCIPIREGLVKADKVDASMKDGVLSIVLPKEEAKAKERKVSVRKKG